MFVLFLLTDRLFRVFPLSYLTEIVHHHAHRLAFVAIVNARIVEIFQLSLGGIARRVADWLLQHGARVAMRAVGHDVHDRPFVFVGRRRIRAHPTAAREVVEVVARVVPVVHARANAGRVAQALRRRAHAVLRRQLRVGQRDAQRDATHQQNEHHR